MAFTYVNLLIEKKGKIGCLEPEERQLFMKASKEKFNLFRDGWKNLLDFQQNETDGNYIKKDKTDKEIGKLEIKIREFCKEMITKADNLGGNVIDSDINSKIFYIKIKADYLRYLAEIANEEEFPDILKDAKTNYETAYKMSIENLPPQDSLYLSVVLNYTVFLYFILDDTRLAFGLADKAYKTAIDNLTYSEEKDPDVDVLIKRIEENLTIWKIELFDIN